MLKIGLTGGIGSGKTSVSELFEKHNVAVIDTDVIAHDLVNDDARVLAEISDAFGQDILNIDGKLNRKKLSQIVFNVKANKQQLENILHPKIQDKAIAQLQTLTSQDDPPEYVIIVVPLLIEAKYDDLVDRILVVITDKQKRIERIQQRDNRSMSEIRAIFSSQVNDKQRLKKADDVIENNNDIKSLNSKIDILHKKYVRLAQSDR